MRISVSEALAMFSKATGAIISVSLIITVIYELVFYFTLGISVREVPTTINDYLRGTLNWAPYIFMSSVLSFMLASIMINTKIQTKDGKAHSVSSVYGKILIGVSVLSIALFTLFGEIVIPEAVVIFSCVIIAINMTMSYISKKELERNHLLAAILFTTFIGMIIMRGYLEGYRAIRYEEKYDKIRLKSNPSKLIEAVKLRQYEKASFIRYKADNKFAFISSEEIVELIKQIDDKEYVGIFGKYIK